VIRQISAKDDIFEKVTKDFDEKTSFGLEVSSDFHALHEIDKPGFALKFIFFIQKQRFIVKVTVVLTFSK
jgi:hypothetical protein